MAKKDLLRDSLVKLVNIFPNDIYIVHNRYVIAGNKSEENTRGYFFCIFEPDIVKVWKEKFPDNPVIYIPSVREAKTNGYYGDIVYDKNEIKRIEDKVETFITKCRNPLAWEPFEFTDKEKEKIFKEGESYTISDKNNRYKVIISKTLFPLINDKTINNAIYAYDKYENDRSLYQLFVRYNHDYFQLNMCYLFLQI